MAWLSRHQGTPSTRSSSSRRLELEAPRKPQRERDWLTHEEFAAMLAAAVQSLADEAGVLLTPSGPAGNPDAENGRQA